MKLLASIVFSLVVAVSAVIANRDRHKAESDQIAIEEAKEMAREDARQFAASLHVEALNKQIHLREESARYSTDPNELALALESLRESRAERRRYQALVR